MLLFLDDGQYSWYRIHRCIYVRVLVIELQASSIHLAVYPNIKHSNSSHQFGKKLSLLEQLIIISSELVYPLRLLLLRQTPQSSLRKTFFLVMAPEY